MCKNSIIDSFCDGHFNRRKTNLSNEQSVYELSTNIIVYSDAGRKVLKRFEFVGKDAHDLGDGYPSRSHSY